MSSLADQLDKEYAPAWRPEPGDKVIGEIIALSEREGDYGPYPIVTIRDDNGGEHALHCFHGVLASEIAKLRPRVGERIGVKYVGQQPRASGDGKYHSYRVVRDEAQAPAMNWSAYADDDDSSGDMAVPTAGASHAADEDIPF